MCPIACGQFTAAQISVAEDPTDTGARTAATSTGLNGPAKPTTVGILTGSAIALGVRRRSTRTRTR